MRDLNAITQLQVTWLLLLLLLLLCPTLVRSRVAVACTAPETVPPGCPTMYGNISMPYPFGIGKRYSPNKSFSVLCSHKYNPSRAYLGNVAEVVDVKLDTGDMHSFTTHVKGGCEGVCKCVDTDGKYECKCNFGRKVLIFLAAAAVLATVVASMLLALLVWFVRKDHRRQQRRGFFDKNSEKILKCVDIKVFTQEQLGKITNDYSTLLGKGAFGIVFMGTTDDNQKVAVKLPVVERDNKAQHLRRLQGNDFVEEIAFHFQMRHENLVRLVGCCLETDVPILVFEYVPKGSLQDVLHGSCALSLTQRLDIAIGSAEALAYMHSHAGGVRRNRIHGDVKSGNILLDDDFKPKVSDFGSSKLASIASRYAEWCVSGDSNYADPVYIRTGRFTEKSDVYSFGVVLLELLTRKKARYDGNSSLPTNFVGVWKKDGDGRKMYDRDVSLSDRHLECLHRLGALAVRCLKDDVDERPTMAEVVDELKKVKLMSE